jgi:flagellar hook-associated protein 3 FlgL
MSMRVATFAMNRQMLSASLTTQSRMAQMQLQEASGLVSTDYGGLGTDARKLISLEVSATRSRRYEAAATSAAATVETTYGALSSIAELLSSFRSQLIAAQSVNAGDTTGTTLIASAAAGLAELVGLLNTQYDGQYVFGGAGTTTAPVDVSGTSFSLDAADTSYYSGNTSPFSAQIGDDQTLSYGVTAADPTIAAVLRALGTVAQANDASALDLNGVLELVTTAIDGVATLQDTNSVTAATLDRAISAQQDLQDFFANAISSTRDVDVTTIAAQLTAYETQLQASFAGLAKIQSLSLLDYLR